MPADMTLANAILAAAAKVSGNGKDKTAIVAWLEMMRVREPALFNELITKLKKEIPNDKRPDHDWHPNSAQRAQGPQEVIRRDRA